MWSCGFPKPLVDGGTKPAHCAARGGTRRPSIPSLVDILSVTWMISMAPCTGLPGIGK